MSFCPFFKRPEGANKSRKKIHTKIHDKFRALRTEIYHDEYSAEGQKFALQYTSNFGAVVLRGVVVDVQEGAQ